METISNYTSSTKPSTFLGMNNEFILHKLRTCTYGTSKNRLRAFIQQVHARASIVAFTRTVRQLGKYGFDKVKQAAIESIIIFILNSFYNRGLPIKIFFFPELGEL